MFVTRENVAALVAQGVLPTGDLCFHVVSGTDDAHLPPLATLGVRWVAANDTPYAVVTQCSRNFPPFTFYVWNDLEVDGYEDDVLLRFVVRTLDDSIPVEVLVTREYARAV